ncbi:6362_t:CDS:2 [Ambispora gerdemannii]|uniref:6362_t:CDS:1 n=1 Tax=Ambispora gerdemannii TaxID=144530 RepID=A0A9N9FR65_9GLOM|nr:6362_t:CDS:2 [Ambispora gerdemannii]
MTKNLNPPMNSETFGIKAHVAKSKTSEIKRPLRNGNVKDPETDIGIRHIIIFDFMNSIKHISIKAYLLDFIWFNSTSRGNNSFTQGMLVL